MSYREQVEEAILARAERPLTIERLRELMGHLDHLVESCEMRGDPIAYAAGHVISMLEMQIKGGYWGIVPGVKPIVLDKIYWLRKDEIVSANDEAIRFGFSRALALDGLPDGLYPVVRAMHHTSQDLLRNIRLTIALDVGNAFLDVTGDCWESIKTHARATAVGAEADTGTGPSEGEEI